MSTDPNSSPSDIYEKLSRAGFEIAGEDQLTSLKAKFPQFPAQDDEKRRLQREWEDLLADLHIRTGTLLKTDTVSLLLGAGASKECGGPLLSTIPLSVELTLLDAGIKEGKVTPWLECFYLAVSRIDSAVRGAPLDHGAIVQRKNEIDSSAAKVLSVNFESLLSLLHGWRSAIPAAGGTLQLDGVPAVNQHSSAIEECIRYATSALARLCRLPVPGVGDSGFMAYKDLLRKVLMRPLNLKRANVFTLNYDTLVEQAADAEGIVLLDGFVGSIRRTFRPESYDHDLYFPAETTEGRVHRLDRVLHLYKLHGSTTWTAEEPGWDNPYGVLAHGAELPDDSPVLIYPTPTKWGEALGMPYAELLRRFAASIVRPQSVLFVVGYGFGDEHVCAIVRQAFAVPSFTLVIVDPDPQSDFVKRLRKQGDRRVWIFSDDTFGTFSGFVRHVFADLTDEGVRRKVMDTYKALSHTQSQALGKSGNSG